MTPRLTSEMRRALAAHPDQMVYVVDEATRQAYVLVAADDAHRTVRALLYDESEPDPNEFLPLIHEALKEDWDALGMEVYD